MIRVLIMVMVIDRVMAASLSKTTYYTHVMQNPVKGWISLSMGNSIWVIYLMFSNKPGTYMGPDTLNKNLKGVAHEF